MPPFVGEQEPLLVHVILALRGNSNMNSIAKVDVLVDLPTDHIEAQPKPAHPSEVRHSYGVAQISNQAPLPGHAHAFPATSENIPAIRRRVTSRGCSLANYAS